MLVGFKSKNHPQQQAKPDVDDRALTPEYFEQLNKRFRFTVDAAASEHNAKLPRFWSVQNNGLEQPWKHERVYCNPPYSNIEPWVSKAWFENEAAIIVMLLPANRTEQRWWQTLIEPFRDCDTRVNRIMTVEFLPGRIRFLKPGQTEIKPNERPPFGCCLCIWQKAREA